MGIDVSQRLSPTGVYRYNTPLVSMIEVAHTGVLGFYFFANSGTPTVTGVPRDIMVKRIWTQFSLTGVTAMPTLPPLLITRGTFTGVLAHSGGTAVVAAKHRTADLLPQGTMRTASTGLTALATVDSNAVVAQFLPPVLSQATAVGLIVPTMPIIEFRPNAGDEIIVKPNECLIVQQMIAGTASDARKFVLGLETQEFRQ